MDPHERNTFAISKGHEKHQVQTTLDCSSRQQDLGLPLYGARMVFQTSVEFQECEIRRSSRYDVEVPCMLQWGLLWYLASTSLNTIW